MKCYAFGRWLLTVQDGYIRVKWIATGNYCATENGQNVVCAGRENSKARSCLSRAKRGQTCGAEVFMRPV